MGFFVFQAQVQNLVEWVKEHEDYNSELQEAEKWLLQMSSRLVTSDSMQTSSMEMATQQLARHKVINFVFLVQSFKALMLQFKVVVQSQLCFSLIQQLCSCVIIFRL